MTLRRLLLATLLTGLAAAGSSGPSFAQLEVTIEPGQPVQTQPSPGGTPGQASIPDPGQQVRSVIYHRLMAEILRTGIRSQMRQGSSEVNPYPTAGGTKVMAACINWDQSSLDRIVWSGFAYRYGGAVGLEELQGLESRALEDCRIAYSGRGCTCQTVDINDENVLEVPANFLAQHARF